MTSPAGGSRLGSVYCSCLFMIAGTPRSPALLSWGHLCGQNSPCGFVLNMSENRCICLGCPLGGPLTQDCPESPHIQAA